MSLLDCAFGPKLFVEYGDPVERVYKPNNIEMFADQVLLLLYIMRVIFYYTWLFLGLILYIKGALVMGNLHLFLKILITIGKVTLLAWLSRGFGRKKSKQYVKFMTIYCLAKNSEHVRASLKKFDYEFSYAPVDFDATHFTKRLSPVTETATTGFRFARLHCEILAYIGMKTFGINMMYPGSIKALQRYLRPVLISGRTRLVQNEGARRFKVKTSDNNEIDTVFIDNRCAEGSGNTLVICCEGNAGFYEVGILLTPLSRNFSVIGWNHPGFEGSTGSPYPLQEKNAIEAIIAFAIYKLQFSEENIVLYGWSIGAYAALWGACRFGNVRGVILDATFDDILPLALSRVPCIFKGIVEIGIRKYCNLDNVAMLSTYNGPIIVIRRLEDEIIAEENKLETNRTNNFILSLLQYRYPNIFTSAHLHRIQKILAEPLHENTISKQAEEINIMRISHYFSSKGKTFPMYIGHDYAEDRLTELADFLLFKYVHDVRSTHCVPLPAENFTLPWKIPLSQGFQFTRLI